MDHVRGAVVLEGLLGCTDDLDVADLGYEIGYLADDYQIAVVDNVLSKMNHTIDPSRVEEEDTMIDQSKAPL